MCHVTCWVLNIKIKLLFVLAGRSAVDIWWWSFWGWDVLCIVNVDSPWWQWHLNGSSLSFLWLCTNIILLKKIWWRISLKLSIIKMFVISKLYPILSIIIYFLINSYSNFRIQINVRRFLQWILFEVMRHEYCGLVFLDPPPSHTHNHAPTHTRTQTHTYTYTHT